jgi:hypothetical protein
MVCTLRYCRPLEVQAQVIRDIYLAANYRHHQKNCGYRKGKIFAVNIFAVRKWHCSYRKDSLWAENCPNFLAGQKKLYFFSGKFKKKYA